MTFPPTYTINDKITSLVANIAAALERYKIVMEGAAGVRLRKLNRIRTLRGTTAIEGNTLTEEQITDILAGKRVIGSKREITEVKGAHSAYEIVESLNPLSSKDLLRAHSLMTRDLVEAPGEWRKCNVAVVNAKHEIIHSAPPWDHVPFLMKDLFAWLKRSKAHPLIKSCVFHCVFETIHPFPDGNGRMGRLWQTVILGAWNPLFYAAPVENMVFSHQREYYRALHSSQQKEDATEFIEYMLSIILRTIKAKGETTQKTTQKSKLKTTQKKVEMIIEAIRSNPKSTIAELALLTGLSVDGVKWNLRKLKDEQRLRRIGPDKGGHWEVA